MIPNSVRAAAALGALALAHSTLAIDFGQSDLNPQQCSAGESCAIYQAAQRTVSAPSETIQGVSSEVAAVQRQELFQWLRANEARVKKAAFSVQLTRQDLIDIGEAPDAGGVILRPDPRRVQVGVDKDLGFEVSFATLHGKRLAGATPHQGGTVTEGLDGELVWTAQAHSRGARALRLGIEEFDLPAGAELYVYSEHSQAFGPYTGQGANGDGVFWTNTIMGDTVTLQMHYYGPRDAASLSSVGFRIGSISHIGSRFPLADFVGVKETGEKSFCSYNASCVQPGSTGGSEVAGAENAVALMIFSSQGGSFICSGGLLADTDTGSTIPYFLTANHCISKGREANSLETFFDFDTSCTDRYAQNGTYPGTNGSSIKSSNRTSDYTLLQLSSNPGGANRVYLGWNNAAVAFSNGTNLYRISHPAGAPQAYSQHHVDTSKGTCSSWPRGNWIYSHDDFGATEGGSSGSPVLNSGGQVVGQLSGGCGTDVNNTCNTVDNATVDGAFAAYWSAVEPFLDPSGGPGGGCTLGQPGDSCTLNSQCCSNNCKGKPGNKTCK